jgi:hypothetical protein
VHVASTLIDEIAAVVYGERMKRLACWVLLTQLLACGSWSGGPEPGIVAARHGAAGASDGPRSDTRPPTVEDSSAPEAIVWDPGSCGALGKACGPGTCPDGLDCENGACVRSNDMCGGSGAAACPTSAPVCLTYAWATGWPCVTRTDRDCICAAPAGRASFHAECGAAAQP